MIVVLNAAIAKHLRAMADIVEVDKPDAARDLRLAEARLYEIAAENDLSVAGRAELTAAAEAARARIGKSSATLSKVLDMFST